MTRHKHADIIHAWAEGAEIQLKKGGGSWITVERPDWLASLEYRIKPRIVQREGWVNIYRTSVGYVTGFELHKSIDDAKKLARCNCVATIKVEFEETE